MIMIVKFECFNIENEIRTKWVIESEIAGWLLNFWKFRGWFNNNNKILFLCVYDELKKASAVISESNKFLIKI